MASLIYNDAKKSILNQEFDWAGNTYKVALVTSTYTPNKDSHTYFSDITNEVSGTGYTAGGYTLGSLSVTVDDTNDLAYLDATDVTEATCTFTARAAIVYESTGTAATSKLIAYIDFGADRSPYQDSFTIQWAADGIIKLTE